MKSLAEILCAGLESEERQATVLVEDWHDFFVQHDYHPASLEVMTVYAFQLVTKAIDLGDFELIDAIEGNLEHLETSILIFLQAKNVRKPNAYLIAALRRRYALNKTKAAHRS